MKVLHVIPSISPVRGGPSLAILEMVKALNYLDTLAEISTTNDHGSELLDVPLKQLVDYQKVPVHFFSRFSPSVHSIREFAYSWSLTSWLWQHIRDYDLIHIHAIFSYPSTVAMAIARHQRIPYIVRPLGQLCQWSLQQSVLKKQLYLKLIERENLIQSSALHFTTTQEQTEATALNLPTPSFVLPHGVHLSDPIPDAPIQLRQHLNLPSNEPIILFLSRLHSKKGLNFLIPALAQIQAQPFTFIIAGSGTPEYETEIRDLIQSHGLTQRTHMLGMVQGDLKQLLLQGSDLFTLTSHSENFGIAVLEALGAGLPVLLTPGIALAALVQSHDLGWVVEMDVEAIATKLHHVLTDAEGRSIRGDRARKLVSESYSWEAIAKKMIQVYETLINSKTP